MDLFPPERPTSVLTLRDYQQRDIERLRAAYAQGYRNVCYQLATGGGKTVVFSHVIESATKRGRRTAVVVHRRELIKQASAKLAWCGVPHGIVAAGLDRDHDAPVLILSIATAIRRLDQLGEFGFVVVDEAHHARAATWVRFLELQPRAKILGVTATPARTDGKGLGIVDGGIFDALVCGPSMKELVAEGFLAPTRCFVPKARIDVSGVRTVAGDYDIEELVERAAQVTGDAVREYTERIPHVPTIAFCCVVKHAEQVAEAFRQAGYRSACVHGELKVDERDHLIGGLSTGAIEVLTSCDLISEGLDVPSTSGIIQLRPTQSLILYLQQLGRGMRPGPGKTLTVLDHAANVIVHGVPTERREWTLAGVAKREKSYGTGKGDGLTWKCPQCECINSVEEDDHCRECGAGKPGRRVPDQVDGELDEIKPEQYDYVKRLSYSQLQARPRTEIELHVYARHRGYKPGWVYYYQREQAERFAPRATPEPPQDRWDSSP